MHDLELLDELKRECARLARIQGLPEEQQRPYENGILKLQRRVDELRAACGMTLDAFVRQMAYAMEQAHVAGDELTRVDFDRLGDYAYAAAAAWERGDPNGIREGLNGIKRVLFEAKAGGTSNERERSAT